MTEPERALFVGGVWHGQYRAVPAGTRTWIVPVPEPWGEFEFPGRSAVEVDTYHRAAMVRADAVTGKLVESRLVYRIDGATDADLMNALWRAEYG